MASGAFADTFDQDEGPLAQKLLVLLLADAVLQVQELVVTAVFDFERDVVCEELGPFGSGALAVLEDEAVLEAALGDQVVGLLEIFFGLAAEADDEIAGDGG